MISRSFKIYKPLLLWGSLFLIAASVGVGLRIYPLKTYVSDPAYNMASVIMVQRLIETFEKNIRSQRKDIDKETLRGLAVRQANDQVAKENTQARRTIYRIARQLDAQNPNAQKFPFLLESDSFLYYDLTQNIIKTGHMAEIRKGSKYLNPKMNYPLGHWEPFNLHPYIGYIIHRALILFDSDTALMYSVAWTPIVISVLSLIVFLLVCGRLALSYWAVLTGAVLFMTAPIFISRSMFGWYDNDPYNIFFPLILLYILVHWFTARKPNPLQSTLALGITVCLYSLFWQGWMYIAVILTASMALVACTEFFMKDPNFKKTILVLIGMPVIVLLGIGLIFGPQEFFRLFQEGWSALNDFMTTQKLPLWPDLYIAVGELKRQSPLETINDTGGLLFVLFAVWGALSGLLISFKEKNQKTFYALTAIALSATASFILSLTAMRFSLLCVTPLAILCAVGIHTLLTLSHTCLKKYQPTWKNALIIFFAGGLLTGSWIVSAVRHQYQNIPSLVHKIYNATWNDSMLDLKTKTPASSVIYTWWPPGHFIKAIADRAVTFDGASINARQAYWLANVFLQTDERKALGILRMINTSANQASEYLINEGRPLSEAARILKSITPLDRQNAQSILNKLHFSESSIKELLDLTHAENPVPAYLMVYNEIIEKHILLSYTGNWDFGKAEEIRKNPELLKRVPPPGQEDYYEFLWNISGGRPLCSDLLRQTSRYGNVILLGQDVEVDLETKHCRVNSPRYGKGIPQYIYFKDGNRIIKKPQLNPTMSTSLIIGERYGQIFGMLLPQNLAESILMKLFFFEGTGMNYLKLISQQKDATLQTQIDLFEVDWNKFLADLSTAE